jgi:hypothetical protein
MGSTASPPGLRISLRELMMLFAAVAIGIAALKLANLWWQILVTGFALLAFTASAIVAINDRGRRQAFAIGFVIAFAIYMGLLYSMRQYGGRSAIQATVNAEFDPEIGALPTTQLLRPLFEAIVEVWYVELATGKRLRQSELGSGAKTGFSRSGGMNTPSAYSVGQIEPQREPFMIIGHCLWALLFGYAGGHFARWVYFRRLREQNATA